ncbi:MAG: mannose-1-phosphate guanylyltransferase/mannose-6-phosphate isomerase [Candidatus Parabeggiatoa sp. nov. 3]|nr:MAG: mannose-1-phosphate guanylyltransferase/mannose-6-phosphate isomerase [Gammaproteobacteria bacterium]RKZ58598.1 MAG: mannose-1-phosphate guanylyltransferase/mannose-6-phosphate isomerase [Gammaproteobacteria bacterium]RKZ82212.1 MAG: mannose-1-phosphate guanylyltransferase/mannose-6-phosphate isomerase [Gammaproteobacteria bacterium]HEW97446.1 mannose-1-phosphate guanylyltransferase/mannose-6-phosphate isomerase [Beggiatoa sp.]
MLTPVILSGGVGSRLWPLSREYYPKQLLALVGNNTLLQDTVLRLSGLPEQSAPLMVCNEAHRFLVAEQLRRIEVSPANIILEPVGRNTAPAAAVAALAAVNPDALLLVLPADHMIADTAAFREAVTAGIPLAQANYLVTFGIVPNRPETGYGYINATDAIEDTVALSVERFVEKPDLETAQQYIDSGNYYWNSGMFLFKASQYLKELETFNPDIVGTCRIAMENALEDKDFLRLDPASFKACPSDSIDYAVMEKTNAAVVIPLDAGWNDIGSWSSLWAVSDQDDEGNVVIGDVLTHNVHKSYLRAEHRLLTAIGVEELAIVETADAVLVAHKDQVQDVKEIVSRLKAMKRNEADLHRKVYRPWGYYESLDIETRYQVKHITVNPGASLSLQLHYHRSEHWVIVKGTARITRDDETFVLTENQSTYISIGVKHRLENPGRLPLEIIEVQSGSYLGEDDIVRYEDVYGRE